MRVYVVVFICLVFSFNVFAQNYGIPQSRGVEPKEPKAQGDPRLFNPFKNPDEEDEPYVEDPDMTRMEMPFKEPEILFDFDIKGDVLERFYEKEPEGPLEFEPDFRYKDPREKEQEPAFFVPDVRGLGLCPKGLRCD